MSRSASAAADVAVLQAMTTAFTPCSLHVNPDPENVRCYRVVNRFGEVSKAFAFGGENEQIRLLKSEGVEVDENGRVDLKKYGMV